MSRNTIPILLLTAAAIVLLEVLKSRAVGAIREAVEG